MMQPSDLDTELFMPSPTLTNLQKKTAVGMGDQTLPDSKSQPSQMSAKEHYSDQTWSSELPSSDTVPSEKSEANNTSPSTSQNEHESTVASVGSDSGNQPSVAVSNESEEVLELGFLPVLRNRNFLTLWSGQVFSQLADKVYLVLMIALISGHFQTGNQSISGWVSAIMMAFTIPAVLFGSVAGVFVDRWPKKEVLVGTNLLRGILVLVIPLLLGVTQGWAPLAGLPVGFGILLGLSFLISTLTQFFAPAEQAAIPLVVERRHLLSANSLYTTTMMALVVVGFAVGEPLLALADTVAHQLGAGAEIGKELVVGGSYAIAGLFLLLLKTGEKLLRTEQATPHVWQDLNDGLRYLGKNNTIRTALIQLVILFSVFGALTVLAVRMAEVIPGLRSSQFGFLLAAGGVGIAAGATILGQFGQRFSDTQLSLCGSTGIAATLIGLSIFTKQLWVVLLLIALLGSFASLVAIPMQTTIQKETHPEMRGKVFGLQNNVINIAMTLPLALAGVAETLFGLQTVFLSLAVTVISGGLLNWYICRTEIKPVN